jgi:hypothetical protein
MLHIATGTHSCTNGASTTQEAKHRNGHRHTDTGTILHVHTLRNERIQWNASEIHREAASKEREEKRTKTARGKARETKRERERGRERARRREDERD